jgi:hypothetical protein
MAGALRPRVGAYMRNNDKYAIKNNDLAEKLAFG